MSCGMSVPDGFKSITYSCRIKKLCSFDPKIICKKKGAKNTWFQDRGKNTNTMCIPSNSVMLGIKNKLLDREDKGSGGDRPRRAGEVPIDNSCWSQKSHFLITPEHATPSQCDSECISEATIKHWNNSSIVPPGHRMDFIEKGSQPQHQKRASLPLIITASALSMMTSKNTLMNVKVKSPLNFKRFSMVLKFVLGTTLEIQCHTLKFAVSGHFWLESDETTQS